MEPLTTPPDDEYLRRCVELAERALEAGDDPFGSVLVDDEGVALAEAMNRETTDRDPTAHPELHLAQWAIANLTPEQRAATTVYTSGEHCPMCAAAHAWAGLGRIVAAVSSEQLADWRASWGLPVGPVRALPAAFVAPAVHVIAPVPAFEQQMRALHERAARRSQEG
ncbi:nucleoside deaminase [Microbacterium sp. HD4P20]|uniref:nucleoside deaminase n=1 Tax=Microbacterium sp. HD4P20 TaxID=2864874 RepID=UPI0020A3017F|nr:nucleoside deaminase [Microbacterium sp. HD4P20]MCP2635409.1 nucleoside deaminase [Microbacterium sp. HD4P20]